jgi:hypothetical protein
MGSQPKAHHGPWLPARTEPNGTFEVQTDMYDEIPKWPMIVLVAFQAALSVYAIVAVVLVH